MIFGSADWHIFNILSVRSPRPRPPSKSFPSDINRHTPPRPVTGLRADAELNEVYRHRSVEEPG